MNGTPAVGIYGKLPAYGDFIFRNLRASFINPWDEWLQHFVSASKEQIGNGWLDIYLTSPIWRFVLSPGVIDNHLHAGILLPSVDRVGRYFPLTVVKKLSATDSPLDIFLNQGEWFRAAEESCLLALNGELDADELVSALALDHTAAPCEYLPAADLGQTGPMVFDIPGTEQGHIRALLPHLANAALAASLSSFSLWATNGSEHVSPVMFSCRGLPPIRGVAAMLDGQWEHRNWKSPYNLQVAHRQ
jgi:type VI secretion system protein ImpM